MRRAACILGLLLLVAGPACARLGETEAETIARYGTPAESVNPGQKGAAYRALSFNHAGYVITAVFIDASCELVCFQKSGSEFTRDDIDLILQSESNGQAWSPSDLASVDVIWTRPDGAMARYDTANHALAVCSAKYLAAESARKKRDEQRKVDSL